MKVTIIGVGALGSHLLLFTRNLKVQFKVIDYDSIESKNLMSQVHTKMGLGKNKALAIQQSLSGLFGIKVEAVPHRLTSDNVNQLLGDADLIVDCMDNGSSRRLVQNYALKKQVPCLHGAVDAGGSFGRVVWSENFVIDDEDKIGAPTCEDGRHLPFIARVSSYMADAVQQYVERKRKVGYQVHPNGVTII